MHHPHLPIKDICWEFEHSNDIPEHSECYAGLRPMVWQRIMSHSAIHVRVNHHPMATLAAAVVDLEPTIVPLQGGNDVAILLRCHRPPSGHRSPEHRSARFRQWDVADPVVRQACRFEIQEPTLHSLSFQVRIELEIVGLCRNEDLIHIVVLYRERYLRLNGSTEFAQGVVESLPVPAKTHFQGDCTPSAIFANAQHVDRQCQFHGSDLVVSVTWEHTSIRMAKPPLVRWRLRRELVPEGGTSERGGRIPANVADRPRLEGNLAVQQQADDAAQHRKYQRRHQGKRSDPDRRTAYIRAPSTCRRGPLVRDAGGSWDSPRPRRVTEIRGLARIERSPPRIQPIGLPENRAQFQIVAHNFAMVQR